MRIVLSSEPDLTATTQRISEEVARRRLYSQKNGGVAHSGQVRIRAINHPERVEMVAQGTVRLVGPAAR
jgi:hypothetical protein